MAGEEQRARRYPVGGPPGEEAQGGVAQAGVGTMVVRATCCQPSAHVSHVMLDRCVVKGSPISLPVVAAAAARRVVQSVVHPSRFRCGCA